MAGRVFVAVDLGASGGRVMVGTLDTETVALTEVHRFPNSAAMVAGHLRWNTDELHAQVVKGLELVPAAESVGIDSWGVDYGLLDDDGTLIDQPISHRDERTADAVAEVHDLLPPPELYQANGLQFLPFNTIYQLVADRSVGRGGRTRHAVLIPDLLAHRLTGVLRTETTNASTTGLLDPVSHDWSAAIFDRLRLRTDLFPPLEAPGAVRGVTNRGTPVTTVGSHDTASAVVAVPATTEHVAYISSGTWSLVGLELPGPVLTEAARTANFTNELGVDGRTRFLRNVGGLWLLQECLRSWNTTDLDGLLAAAASQPSGLRIDVDDDAFIAPGDMPDRIGRATGVDDMIPAAIVRCILDSLADAYARTLDAASRLTGRAIDAVHIVGGGCRNELLCRLTAEATGRPVIAGPVEATALGNVLVQARAHGAAPAALTDLRALVRNSFDLRRYEPS